MKLHHVLLEFVKTIAISFNVQNCVHTIHLISILRVWRGVPKKQISLPLEIVRKTASLLKRLVTRSAPNRTTIIWIHHFLLGVRGNAQYTPTWIILHVNYRVVTTDYTCTIIHAEEHAQIAIDLFIFIHQSSMKFWCAPITALI